MKKIQLMLLFAVGLLLISSSCKKESIACHEIYECEYKFSIDSVSGDTIGYYVTYIKEDCPD